MTERTYLAIDLKSFYASVAVSYTHLDVYKRQEVTDVWYKGKRRAD